MDLDGREHALYAAYLSATAFASAGSGLHHKICHVLGGKYNLPHAQTHATVLPYVLAFNGPAAPVGLSALIPEPNSTGTQNYRIVTSQPASSDNLNVRLNRSLDAKNRLASSAAINGGIPSPFSSSAIAILPTAPATITTSRSRTTSRRA